MKIIAFLVLFASFYVLFVGLVQFVRQQVAVAVFHAPDLTFWQTAGGLFLLGLVTQGFRAATTSKK